ncbi:hypothetical protein [Petrimonas sp.]|uniref:hypothetical protein n=1 Tax=Petrimonas sp. TaxID=2023866 RepID=UPI002FC8AABC
MKLPLNFEIKKYGLYVRLINESDAEFIVKLRTQEKARFMNTVSSDVEKQKEWIREYKIREHAGLDYYFIYYLNETALGINRIYNIQEDSFVGGSFVFLNCDFEIPIFATLIEDYIGFEILDKSACFGNIKKENKRAIKYNKLYGADFIYEDETEVFFISTKKMYLKKKAKFERLFYIN